ncbi:aldo/keto reductase [Rhodococcus sp. Eu-32]|uniref:aldo/keto reductase n=1 Tax=Rhodococcus sp. Eu-32 TaxID=1017319 RepID=UPI000DF38118|nr:aldo/keto reductase [Rhodococcus sp. Eu-32]RRQ29453.1 aldo/keto reductase [Rhodococcus sp. Eu-32]
MTYSAADTRYDDAQFRRSGKSGLQLPQFSLGLWQNFGDNRSFETQREIILRAFDLGITHFDLANRYGPPFRAAEKVFGRVLATDLGRYRDEILIASKAGNPIGKSPYLKGGSRKTLLDSLDISLRDLGVDHVDIFYSHSPDLDTPLEETIAALASAVQQGKAHYIGISNYTAERAHDAAVIAERLGTPLLVHQSRYSIFDRTVERDGQLDIATQDGTGVVAFSPLAQGLLTDKYLNGQVPKDSRAASSAFLSADDISDEYITRAGFLNKIAESRGQSLPQLALQWVLRRPEVTTALIGASSTTQLEHNLAATEFPELTDDDLARIDEYGIHGTALRPKK